jgi:uncharacterized membrane protein YhaH (DUF805 family)
LCRSCATDMPRGIAAKEEAAAQARAERLAQSRTKRGATAASARGSAHTQSDEDGADPWGWALAGRISRAPYIAGQWLATTAIVLLLYASLIHITPVTVWVAILGTVALTVWQIRLTVPRLHDINRTGWWVLLYLLVVPGLLLWLALMAWPGTEGGNPHGEQPRPSAQALALVAVLACVLVLGLTWSEVQPFMDEAMQHWWGE